MPVITDLGTMLRRPGFWSAYYGGRVTDSEDEDGAVFLDRVFGADPDFDHESLWGPDPYDVITDEMDDDEQDRAMNSAMAAGAVLRLPFPSGYTWSIRFSSSPGVYHGLSAPHGDDRISLGYDDPHFHLPILRWSEVWQIAAGGLGRHPALEEPVSFPTEFILPLLAPVTWATSPDEAVEAERGLAEAWAATGMISPGCGAELAARLVLHATDLTWRPDPVLGWTNNGRHSHRNPASSSWSPDEFAVFRRFLDSLRTDSTTTSTAPAHTGTAPAVATVRWRFDADGPIEPTVVAARGQVYCFTSEDAKLRALDAATGREHWHTGVMSRGFGYNTVAVSDGTVYYAGGSRSLDLVAFTEHGSGEAEVNWVHAVGAEGMRYTLSGAYCGWADTTPVVADGRVFVSEDNLYTWQLTSSGPQPGWEGYLPGVSTPRSRPVVVGDRVYVAVGDDYRKASTVQVFDVTTGTRIRHLVRCSDDPFPEHEEIELAGAAQDLVAHDDTLFVAADALTALDPVTGEVRWSVVTERQWSGAIGVTDEWVVGTTCRLPSQTRTAGPEWQYTMVGVDRRSREVMWTFTTPGRLASRGVVLDGQTAYSVGYDDRDATLYAVDVTTGKLRWQYPLGRSTCLPAVADGTVYVSTSDGALLAVCHQC